MKMFNKENLKYKNGLFVSENGDIVAVDNEIVDLANELETNVQKAMWFAKQPKAMPLPNISEFVRESEIEIEDQFSVATPLLDKQLEESMKLMAEIDEEAIVDQMNHALNGIKPLVMFVNDDSVISCENGSIHRFDCPTLGNPLEWTQETINNAIALCHGYAVDHVEETVVNNGE